MHVTIQIQPSAVLQRLSEVLLTLKEIPMTPANFRGQRTTLNFSVIYLESRNLFFLGSFRSILHVPLSHAENVLFF